ncbi:MAG: rRNA maturation RNase YbeY [Clostridiales bacterium]|jgi:probable rRNA maturation factor|nr:rRNA maturation RNase YbeY [Clostridiales bacterium]
MTIHLDYEATKQLDIDYNALINRVVEGCLDYEDCPYETEISILLTDDNEIREINRQFRGFDKPTDVLSFPAIEYKRAGDFSDLEEDSGENFNPETGELILGDIVISVDRAILQSEEYGHSITREIAFLTAHSMFHLMGYDHMSDEQRESLEEKQKQVLDRLEIFR